MNILAKCFFGLAFAGVSLFPANGATVVFDNLTASGDAAHGVRDSQGVLVSGTTFQGAIGRFTISNTAIEAAFALGDTGAISSGFQQFDATPTGTFALYSFVPGAFQTTESFGTKASSNTWGGSIMYAVFYKGASISAATELFIAQLNTTFPTDPEVGAALNQFTSIRPSTITDMVVGTTGASFDYGLGGGAQSTFQLAQVGAVPEPSRMMLVALGAMGVVVRRRRK